MRNRVRHEEATRRVVSPAFMILGVVLVAGPRDSLAMPATDKTTLASVGVGQGNGDSYDPAISANGRYVAFWSSATNLVAGDGNGKRDAFVHEPRTGKTTRVSVNSAGIEGNGDSDDPAINASGRYVAFVSLATNLVAGDGNGKRDVFVRDLKTGQTTRVSVDSAGIEGNGDSFGPAISADGRYVAFESLSTNLIAGDGNAVSDVFVHDRKTGQTTRVSVDSTGNDGNASSFAAAISANGRYVAFESLATDLVASDGNGVRDVFVRDRKTGQTTRVSVDSAGIEGNSDSYDSAISANGRFVAFYSSAANLVTGDGNGQTDVFVRDVKAGQTTRVSVDSAAIEGNGGGIEPVISATGRYVAFTSFASNLVSGDGNGTLDVFVRDVKAGHTTRVSVDSLGIEGNGICATPAMSANGRYIAYGAWATNLVAGDINAVRDVFVHDRKSERTIRASLTAPGTQADHTSVGPSITASGRYIAFHSSATNLVANDTNAASDVFVHDRKTGRTTRVSVSSFGIEGDGDSRDPAISANGRYVAFVSAATTLVAGDGNESSDVFVHDRKTGQTTRVSVDSLGNEAGFGSFNPMISASGRYVVFWSMATNLVVGDGNGSSDVFVHDRKTGQTTRVSVDSAGIEGNFGSEFPAISANGRHVAFHSSASNLVSGDGNGTLDVFVHDRKTRQTTRVSVNSAADEGNDVSYGASLSANGRYVAFLSYAGNLVPGDPGGVRDAFVHDRVTGQTTKVSVNEAGVGGNDESTGLRITADGRYVAFISLATNLVAGDGNGTFDVFVRDLKAGQTTRVSVDSAGIEGNDSSVGVAISANGRYVAFDSLASNLVLGDVNGNIDVFVRDMK